MELKLYSVELLHFVIKKLEIRASEWGIDALYRTTYRQLWSFSQRKHVWMCSVLGHNMFGIVQSCMIPYIYEMKSGQSQDRSFLL